ncbi:hypothetical protein, partial [Burkholderia stagnalis]
LAFAWHNVAPWPSVYASHTNIRIGSILAEVIVEFRKRQPNNAHVADGPESAFAFGPDLLALAREVEQGEVQR